MQNQGRKVGGHGEGMKLMKYSKPLLFIALSIFGVYTIEFGVVGILPVIIERFHITAACARVSCQFICIDHRAVRSLHGAIDVQV